MRRLVFAGLRQSCEHRTHERLRQERGRETEREFGWPHIGPALPLVLVVTQGSWLGRCVLPHPFDVTCTLVRAFKFASSQSSTHFPSSAVCFAALLAQRRLNLYPPPPTPPDVQFQVRTPRGDVSGILDIAKCLYDAVSRLQRTAKRKSFDSGDANEAEMSMLAELGKGKGKKSKAAMQAR